jgi:hypothetical protein
VVIDIISDISIIISETSFVNAHYGQIKRGIFVEVGGSPVPKDLFSIYPHAVWQVFFRHALPNFFAIHTVLLQKFVCAWRKDPLPSAARLDTEQVLKAAGAVCKPGASML